MSQISSSPISNNCFQTCSNKMISRSLFSSFSRGFDHIWLWHWRLYSQFPFQQSTLVSSNHDHHHPLLWSRALSSLLRSPNDNWAISMAAELIVSQHMAFRKVLILSTAFAFLFSHTHKIAYAENLWELLHHPREHPQGQKQVHAGAIHFLPDESNLKTDKSKWIMCSYYSWRTG